MSFSKGKKARKPVNGYKKASDSGATSDSHAHRRLSVSERLSRGWKQRSTILVHSIPRTLHSQNIAPASLTFPGSQKEGDPPRFCLWNSNPSPQGPCHLPLHFFSFFLSSLSAAKGRWGPEDPELCAVRVLPTVLMSWVWKTSSAPL